MQLTCIPAHRMALRAITAARLPAVCTGQFRQVLPRGQAQAQRRKMSSSISAAKKGQEQFVEDRSTSESLQGVQVLLSMLIVCPASIAEIGPLILFCM